MMLKQFPPVQITDGIWWLGSSKKEEFLQVNTYLLYREGVGIIFDPGPVGCFNEIYAACMSIAPMREINALVVSHQDPDICASIPLWESSGFTGVIIAHWRTYLLLPSYGISSTLRSVYQALGEVESSLLGIHFISLPYLHAPGTIGTYDRESGTLFSGDLFGALGKNLPLTADESYQRKMILFHEQYMPSSAMLHAALKRLSVMDITRICPQHGSIIEEHIPEAIAALQTARCGQLDDDVSTEEFRTMAEIDQLRKESFILQQNLVMAADEKLLDPLTGLYNKDYFEQYLPAFFSSPTGGTLGYIRLDKMKAYNNEFGFNAGNEAIQTFVRIILETKRADMMVFRYTGPSAIICIPSEVDAIIELTNLQKALADSNAFMKEVTVSAAVAFISETRDAKELYTLLRERLRLLDSLGAGSLCASHGNTRETKVGTMLIIESDPVFRSFLDKYFISRRFNVTVAGDGGEALQILETLRPVLVICEMVLPQYDAFQIHGKMSNTTELARIPFILMARDKEEITIKRVYGSGIRYLLKKPFMMAELEGLVRLLWEDADATR